MKKFLASAALCAVALVALAAAPVSAHGYSGHGFSAGFSTGYSNGCQSANYSNIGVFAVPYVQQIAVAVPVYQAPPVVVQQAPVYQAPVVQQAPIVEAPIVQAPPVVYQPPVLLEAPVFVTPSYSYGASAAFSLPSAYYANGWSGSHNYGNGHLPSGHHGHK